MNRHTACTNMAKQGMNVKVLKYIMGHAHSDVTMDVYTHIANKQDIREEVERYARVLGLQNFNKIISTHLLLRGGVHYLTLSGLVKPVKWRFSRLCFFIRLHQIVSFLSQMGYEMGYGRCP